jgi:hypothetical protein
MNLNSGISTKLSKVFDWRTDLPAFRRYCQSFPRPRIKDIASEVFNAMDSLKISEFCNNGQTVAVTAGSRGISQIPEILRLIVNRIKYYGGKPIIVPAMGSHGGATSDGQTSLLAELGIVEETVDAPIVSSMDVIEIGSLQNGMPVFIDKIAFQSDAIIVVNRIKPHTDFTSRYQSGLAKMTAIGLGKQAGADTIHRYGAYGLIELIPQAARLIVEKSPIVGGIAILENAYHEIATIKQVTPSGIAGDEEAKLLEMAYSLFPKIPLDDIDLLIVDELGKNISGTGMDAKTIGRVKVFGSQEPDNPKIRTIVVLDITKESHGNAVGIGLADVTTQSVFERIDFESMYINSLTSGITGIQRAFIPIVAPNDRLAIYSALRACGRPDLQNARIVRIKNTLELELLDISDTVPSDELENLGLQVIKDSFGLSFNDADRLEPIMGY